MRSRTWVSILTGVCLTALVSGLGAQETLGLSPTAAGKLHAGMDTRVLSFIRMANEGRNDWDATNLTVFGFGSVSGRFALAGPVLGLLVGGTVMDGLQIGGRVSFGTSTESDGDNEEADGNTLLVWELFPYVEYAFQTGMIQPFLQFTFGLTSAFQDRIDADPSWRYFGFGLGGGGGVHFFLAPVISIDLCALIIGSFGHWEARAQVFEADYDLRGIMIDTRLGLSGWF